MDRLRPVGNRSAHAAGSALGDLTTPHRRNAAIETLISLSVTVLLCGGCRFSSPRPLPTVAGPEAEHLLDGCVGTIAWADWGQLESFDCISLPDETSFRVPVRGAVCRLSGPDEDGNVVYIATGGIGVELRRIRLTDGWDTRVLRMPAATFDDWGRDFTSIDLAPRGGRVLVSRLAGMAPHGGPDYELIVCNIHEGTSTRIGDHLVRRCEWMPDAKSALVEVWIDPTTRTLDSRPPQLPEDELIAELARSFQKWPSIQRLDPDTGELRWVSWGYAPHVTPDGRFVLYSVSPERPPRLQDLDSGIVTDLELPGLLEERHWRKGETGLRTDGLVYGWLSDSIVVYDALPTEGQDPGVVPAQAMQGFHPKWTIKAADIRTGAYKTLVLGVEAPDCSLGRWMGSRR